MGHRLEKFPQSDASFECKPAAVCIQESWREFHQVRKHQPRTIPADEAEAILFALAQAMEQRDPHTASHCERIAFVAVALGVMMGLEQSDLLALYRGGFLHDIGKVGIPDSILFKPAKLTPDEWVTMRTHPTRGVEICRHLQSLQTVLPLIHRHHERWDGSGYPDGLSGEQIPLLARVLQVGDIYDALTSPRPYKPAYTPAEALCILETETQRGWRDPAIIKLFFRLHEEVLMKMQSSDGNLAAMRNSLAQLG